MKNKCVRFICFVCIAVICLLLCDYFIFVPRIYKTRYSRFYEENENSLDVVFVGNSTVSYAFNPCQIWHNYNITSYNLSAFPMHPEVILIAIDEIERTQQPKVVFIDLNGLTYQKESDQETFVQSYITCMPDGDEKQNLIESYDYLSDINKKKGKSLFQYHNEFRNPSFWASLFSFGNRYSKGHTKTSFCLKQKVIEIDEEKTLDLPKDGQKYLEKILEKCKKYPDTKFIFGKTPRFLNESTAEETYMLRSAIPKIEECGYEFIDFSEYNEKMGLNANTDMLDANHLNNKGSKKFSDYFAEFLLEKYIDKDTLIHDEKTKENFDYAYKKYMG